MTSMKDKIIIWLNKTDPYDGVSNLDGILVFVTGVTMFTFFAYLAINL